MVALTYEDTNTMAMLVDNVHTWSSWQRMDRQRQLINTITVSIRPGNEASKPFSSSNLLLYCTRRLLTDITMDRTLNTQQSAARKRFGTAPPDLPHRVKEQSNNEAMDDMPSIHEDPPTRISGKKGSTEEQLEEERQMPEDERASEMEREMRESRQQAEEQKFENQQIVKSAANQIAWIQGVLKIPKYRRGMKGQRLLFQHKPWGPRGRTWATDFGTGSGLIRGNLVMTEKIFQLQVGEITYFLEMRNAMMLLEELLEIPVILMSTVQGKPHAGCASGPHETSSSCDSFVNLIVYRTGKLEIFKSNEAGVLH